jgi:hypothetical protein
MTNSPTASEAKRIIGKMYPLFPSKTNLPSIGVFRRIPDLIQNQQNFAMYVFFFIIRLIRFSNNPPGKVYRLLVQPVKD